MVILQLKRAELAYKKLREWMMIFTFQTTCVSCYKDKHGVTPLILYVAI